MPSQKEIGSKFRKKIISLILAPQISSDELKANIQYIAENDEKSRSLIYNRNWEVRFFLFENQYLPSIQFIREYPTINLPSVKVDEGAVQYILNGADIFAQGITSVEGNFSDNTIVLVRNPQDAVLALGKSLKSSSELPTFKGKAILNIHYLGDSIWQSKF
ncbi:MAG: PUA domain-containing protein [Candidatus Hodarchaeales archaeon]|jgi:predicted RNA-binding protein (TIGR00451 family)